MSTESPAPKPNVAALKKPAVKPSPPVNEAETVAPHSPATQAMEPAPSETIAEIVQIEGKVVRKDRAIAAATKPTGNETIATEAPDLERDAELDLPPGDDKVGTVLGDYKLLRKLGQGGMGEVYEAHHMSLDRIIAMKLLARELSNKDAFVQRFQREARTMVKVDHPNVLRCFDVGKANGYHFLTMEFISGGSVEDWLKKLGRFPIGDALHIILKIADALQHAHERNIIHRDIKPDNVLLTKDGVIKLADLGLAKDMADDVALTKTGTGAGTPIYMAPEQARDAKRVDGRVDIYALGVMLYVFLTGLPPFKGTTIIELIAAKDKGKFDPIRKHNADVPTKLDLIVDKMLAMDPKLRFATCAAVIAELEALGLANETLSFLEAKTPPKRVPIKKNAQVQTKPQARGKETMKAIAPTQPAEEETPIEKDVWYWNLVTPEGKIVNKKVTTDQIRTLIKAGHLHSEAQISKTKSAGYRGAATFPEFQAHFKSREMNTNVNVHRREFGNQMKELVEQDASDRRSSGLTKLMKSFGGTLFSLLWILLILAGVVAGSYFLYVKVIAKV